MKKLKVRLTNEQVDFLKANASVYHTTWVEGYLIPFVYTRDPEDDDENAFELIHLSEINIKQLELFRIENLFTLEQMKACALAMANWGEGFENALNPRQYFSQVLGVEI